MKPFVRDQRIPKPIYKSVLFDVNRCVAVFNMRMLQPSRRRVTGVVRHEVMRNVE